MCFARPHRAAPAVSLLLRSAARCGDCTCVDGCPALYRCVARPGVLLHCALCVQDSPRVCVVRVERETSLTAPPVTYMSPFVLYSWGAFSDSHPVLNRQLCHIMSPARMPSIHSFMHPVPVLGSRHFCLPIVLIVVNQVTFSARLASPRSSRYFMPIAVQLDCEVGIVASVSLLPGACLADRATVGLTLVRSTTTRCQCRPIISSPFIVGQCDHRLMRLTLWLSCESYSSPLIC